MHLIQDKQSAGFTLIELLIAMAIAGIISAAMYALFEAQVRGQVSQDVGLEMTQGLRSAFGMIENDIRMAGCDPLQTANAGIVLADANQLRVTMDIGGGAIGEPDGDADDVNEDVRYAINAEGNIGRDIGGAGDDDDLQPIALNCDALNFVYLDANGAPLATPVANRGDIRSIQVSAVVRSADAVNPGILKSYVNNTSYRNLRNVEILAPQGDSFRRFQLSATIDCRNQ